MDKCHLLGPTSLKTRLKSSYSAMASRFYTPAWLNLSPHTFTVFPNLPEINYGHAYGLSFYKMAGTELAKRNPGLGASASVWLANRSVMGLEQAGL